MRVSTLADAECFWSYVGIRHYRVLSVCLKMSNVDLEAPIKVHVGKFAVIAKRNEYTLDYAREPNYACR